MGQPLDLQIEILDRAAVDELIGKVNHAAEQPDHTERVRTWRSRHGHEQATEQAHSFVVVGSTLMFLHRCPDGVILPFAAYPDGTLKVYTDAEHAGESFVREGGLSPKR